MTRHGAAVLRVARSYSRSVTDAEDAYQRAFEVLLTKPPRLTEGDDPLPWLLTVARNEALMIRRKQKQTAEVAYEDVVGDWADILDTPADRVVELEDVRRKREALLRINPDQARCLLLRADGLSYNEIADETGFSYAKVHNALTEGRRVYRGLLDRMDAGAECRRLEPLLSKLVDDELAAAERSDVELHLGNCGTCRAVVRDYGEAPREIASLFPVGAAAGGFAGSLADAWGNAAAWVNERLLTHMPATPAAEIAFGKKLALATVAAGTIVAGGVGAQYAISGSDREGDNGAAAAAAASAAKIAQAKPVTERRAESKRTESRPSKRARRATAGDLLSSGNAPSSGSARTADDADPPPRFVEPEPQSEPPASDLPDPVANSDPPPGDLALP